MVQKGFKLKQVKSNVRVVELTQLAKIYRFLFKAHYLLKYIVFPQGRLTHIQCTRSEPSNKRSGAFERLLRELSCNSNALLILFDFSQSSSSRIDQTQQCLSIKLQMHANKHISPKVLCMQHPSGGENTPHIDCISFVLYSPCQTWQSPYSFSITQKCLHSSHSHRFKCCMR